MMAMFYFYLRLQRRWFIALGHWQTSYLRACPPSLLANFPHRFALYVLAVPVFLQSRAEIWRKWETVKQGWQCRRQYTLAALGLDYILAWRRSEQTKMPDLNWPRKDRRDYLLRPAIYGSQELIAGTAASFKARSSIYKPDVPSNPPFSFFRSSSHRCCWRSSNSFFLNHRLQKEQPASH